MATGIIQAIEFGRVVDLFPDMGKVMLRVRGERTHIEYLGSLSEQMIGPCPCIGGRVLIERNDGYPAFYFSQPQGVAACS